MRATMHEKDVFSLVFCIEDVSCVKNDFAGYDYRASLYHDSACITVAFSSARRMNRIKNGCFVSVNWRSAIHSEHGAVQVAGLTVRNCMSTNFNPFKSVPHTWRIERRLVDCARDLWCVSPRELRRMLVDAVLIKTEAGWVEHDIAA